MDSEIFVCVIDAVGVDGEQRRYDVYIRKKLFSVVDPAGDRYLCPTSVYDLSDVKNFIGMVFQEAISKRIPAALLDSYQPREACF